MLASMVRISTPGYLPGLLLASASWADGDMIDLKVGDKVPTFVARTDADAT